MQCQWLLAESLPRIFNSPLYVATFTLCMMTWRKPLVQAPWRLHPSSPPLVTSSHTEANRWRGGQNTTRNSTPGRTLSLTQLLRVPALCLSCKSLMFHPQWRNSVSPSTPLLAAKLQEKITFHQKSSRLVSRLLSSNTSTSFCYSAGMRGLCPKICVNANIITLYKNKGDCRDWNNCHRISLLCIVGKALTCMVLNRLQVLAECIYLEVQCGFRAQRSTIDMIFSLHQSQEKCCEQRWPLYITFIDLTKAFDLVSRKGLFTLLQRIGCCPRILRMITSFHDGMWSTVQYDGSSSDPFPIRNGVKHSLASSSPCRCLTYSVSQKTAYTSAPEVMEASSALHVYKWRPRFKEYWLGSCYLQMMLSWLHTLRKLYSNSSAASHVHAESLVLLSVLRRPTSWDKASVASQASPLVTTPLRW